MWAQAAGISIGFGIALQERRVELKCTATHNDVQRHAKHLKMLIFKGRFKDKIFQCHYDHTIKLKSESFTQKSNQFMMVKQGFECEIYEIVKYQSHIFRK
jgi:hypothetical protein